ncbi:MAG: hypothetical protein ACRDJH_26420 [Thermomicrobiales bacterium]
MYARVSTFHGSADHIDEKIAVDQERLVPALRQLAGFEGLYVLVDREACKWLVVTLWESDEALRVSEEEASRLRTESAERDSATIAAIERYEVVVQP